MKKFILLITLLLFLFSCKENSKRDLGNFSILLSNQNFNYDLKSGIFKIPGINFAATIILNEVQKDKITKAFYKFHIDTLNGEKNIVPKKPMTMPAFIDVIEIRNENIQKSKLYISNQLKASDLNNVETGIYGFKKQLIEILNTSSDFKNCMNKLNNNYKNLPPAI